MSKRELKGQERDWEEGDSKNSPWSKSLRNWSDNIEDIYYAARGVVGGAHQGGAATSRVLVAEVRVQGERYRKMVALHEESPYATNSRIKALTSHRKKEDLVNLDCNPLNKFLLSCA